MVNVTEDKLQCMLALLEPEDIETAFESMPGEIPERRRPFWWKRKKMEAAVLDELGLARQCRLIPRVILFMACIALLTACTCYVVQKLQFTPGFGVHDRPEEPLYTMKETEHPVLEEKGIRIELLFLTYQSDKMTARLRITDRDGIYSAIRKEKEGVWPRFAGPGTSVTGYGFDREQIWENGKIVEKGVRQYEQELFMEDRKIEVEDGGAYEIMMPGLEGSLSFTMKLADLYESLEEIGSCDIHDNKAVLAFAENTEGKAAVRTYTYSSDAATVLPVPALYGKTGEETVGLEAGGNYYPWRGEYVAGEVRPDGNAEQGAAMVIPVPEGTLLEEMTLTIPGLMIETEEMSEEIVIPVSEAEKNGKVSVKTEFKDCTIRVTAEIYGTDPKLEGLYPLTVITSDEKSSEMQQISLPKKMKLCLEIQEKDGRLRLYDLVCESNTEADSGSMSSAAWNESEKLYGENGEKELEGFLVSYREGEKQVKVRFCSPVYYYHQEFRIPLSAEKEPASAH